MKPLGKKVILLVLLVVTAVFLSGCVQRVIPKKKVTLGQASESSDEQAAGPGEALLLRQAESAYSRARYQEALDKYKAFLNTYPYSRQSAPVMAAMGQILEIQEKPTQAAHVYEQLIRRYPASPFADEGRRRLAAILLTQGKYAQARDLVTPLLAKSKGVDEKARLRLLLGQAQLGLGNGVQALDLFLKAERETSDPADRDQASRLARNAVDRLGIQELTHAQSVFGKDEPGGYVAYVLTYRLIEAGRQDEARLQLAYFENNFPNHDKIMETPKLRAALEGRGPLPTLTVEGPFEQARQAPAAPVPPATAPVAVEPIGGPTVEAPFEFEGSAPEYQPMDIACILPLSGQRAKYGELILTGLQLAFKTYQPTTPGFSSNLVAMDSKGSPQEGVKALQEASSRRNVLAVVGPLLSNVAEAVGPKAEELSMPLLSISPKSGVTKSGRYVFRLLLSWQAQAKAVAAYATQVLGLKSFAVLYPTDNYGQTMLSTFSAEVKRLGGRVTGVEGYKPDTKDFSRQIQNLAGLGKVSRRVKAGHKVSVDFDAVFLPDRYVAIAMIAPQFNYHDITSVKMLGTDLWLDDRLLSTTSRYVQGAIIPAPFFPDKDEPEVRRFIEAYQAEKGGDPAAKPGKWEAYGYDAGLVLLSLMDRAHVSSRDELVRALPAVGAFRGVTGRFSFGTDGEYVTEPTLLTVQGNQFKLIQ
ncbi:MAG: penicillin-binding protein activator [Pseudomonadota bacterium]